MRQATARASGQALEKSIFHGPSSAVKWKCYACGNSQGSTLTLTATEDMTSRGNRRRELSQSFHQSIIAQGEKLSGTRSSAYEPVQITTTMHNRRNMPMLNQSPGRSRSQACRAAECTTAMHTAQLQCLRTCRKAQLKPSSSQQSINAQHEAGQGSTRVTRYSMMCMLMECILLQGIILNLRGLRSAAGSHSCRRTCTEHLQGAKRYFVYCHVLRDVYGVWR